MDPAVACVDEVVVVKAMVTDVVVREAPVSGSVLVAEVRVAADAAVVVAVVVETPHARPAPSRASAARARPSMTGRLLRSARPAPLTTASNPL